MQEFQREKVEPVRKMYDETRRVGQTLIQSAAAGVSTTDIEFNLQSLNTVWTTLTDRVLHCTQLTYLLTCVASNLFLLPITMQRGVASRETYS